MTTRTVQAHPHAIAAREERRAEAYAMGINEAFIAEMVDRFYASVREDAMLGPIFDERIDDWPKHLGQMNRFWQTILLSAGNFTGNPMMKHLAIPTIGQEHFQQWLRLFYQTLDDIAATPEAVRHVGAKARMIAESLLTGIWVHRDRSDPLEKKVELPDV
ncbi:group III truncated hemoglobin [Sphingopyxis flava]|uniref:Hemoglobin n=1 Tax=Sphingopyxis flava TaxID=1507287 RepID=A0A1T5E2Y2_9SPHN|nr:group III truncated hemoglobin [Sphingopyxis flava]SKB78297.1 hemoglobin [Sphingopyxis flava]